MDEKKERIIDLMEQSAAYDREIKTLEEVLKGVENEKTEERV